MVPNRCNAFAGAVCGARGALNRLQ